MNNLSDILSMVGSLVLIVLILAFAYYGTRWYARRMGQPGLGAGKYIKVLDRVPLGAGTTLVIIQVADKFYLLGVGDKSVRLVSELPDFGEHVREEPQQHAPFSQMLRQLTDKSGKNKDNGDRQ